MVKKIQSRDGEEGNNLIFGKSPSQFTWKHNQYLTSEADSY